MFFYLIQKTPEFCGQGLCWLALAQAVKASCNIHRIGGHVRQRMQKPLQFPHIMVKLCQSASPSSTMQDIESNILKPLNRMKVGKSTFNNASLTRQAFSLVAKTIGGHCPRGAIVLTLQFSAAQQRAH